MTQPLEYALPATDDPPTWRRFVFNVLYFLGWSIGGAVAGAFTTLFVHGVGTDDDLLYIAALAVGAAGGAASAFVVRRVRRLHVITAALSAPATLLFALAAIHQYRSPFGLMWWFEVQLFLALLFAAAAMLTAGLAGLALTRRGW